MTVDRTKASRVAALLNSPRAGEPTKFMKIAALLSSAEAGERRNAADLAYALIEAAGVSWYDILIAGSDAARDAELRIATEACEYLKMLLAERDARIAELESKQPDWQPIARVTIGNHNRAAKWLIELGDDSKISLSARERSFLGTCAAWIGPLRPKQKPFLQSIVDRVHKQYGFAPPP